VRVFWWKDCGDIRRFESIFVRCCYHNLFKLAEGQTDAFIVDIVDAVGTANLG